MQVGGVQLSNGTRLVVAEGTRAYPQGYPADASNESSFVLASDDDGLHWSVSKATDSGRGRAG